MKYYVDTCVWIDFIEDRTDSDFFIKCIENNDTIIYSYPLEKELLKYIHNTKLKILYTLFLSKGLIEIISVTEASKSEAFNLSNERKIPFADALHAVLARDNNAILITRDKHFLKLLDICSVNLL